MSKKPITFDISALDATIRLGEALALILRPGDVLALAGELGAGKTELARALLRAFSDQADLDVPSPTYTLAQTYGGSGFRFPILHADLYRVRSSDEILELGLDDALRAGALIVEWPERYLSSLPSARIDVRLAMEGERRVAELSSEDADIEKRLARLSAIAGFLETTSFASAARRFLQGDASPRAYERLHHKNGETAVLLNALAQPDRSVGKHRLIYMKATHLAPNDAIAPVLAIGAELRRHGFSVPEHFNHDVAGSLLLQEDFGNNFIAEDGAPVPERYEAAIDTLVRLHGQIWPDTACGPQGVTHAIPPYSRQAFQLEARLFLEFFLPILNGTKASAQAIHEFEAAFDGLFDSLQAAPRNWTLFDFHSPNVMWLAERDGIRRVGLLDFQDTRIGPEAYDLVSLTQDARVTVSEALEKALFNRYAAERRQKDPSYDIDTLATAYVICGAQRATRILGVFARLAHQDNKPFYLRHIPRVSDYLDRCLTHPVTIELKEWFAAHAPQEARSRAARAA